MDKHKELPSWNDHYNKTLQLALKHCMEFPNQFSGFPNRVALSYATSLHLEAMELAGHSSKQVFQPDKKKKKSQAFFKPSSVKGAVSSFTL